MRITLIIISILLLLAGIFVTWHFFYILSEHFEINAPSAIDMSSTGQSGDFIGGIVGTIISLAGTILLLVTLNSQSKANFISSFEEKFFKLIELHRANVDEVLISRPTESHKENKIEKRKAFKTVFDEVIMCRDEISFFFSNLQPEDIYTIAYLEKLGRALNQDGRVFTMTTLAHINIAYCIVFFGVSLEGEVILRRLFKDKFNATLIDRIIQFTKMKPIRSSVYWKKWESLISIVPSNQIETTIDSIVKKRNDDTLKAFEIETHFYPNNYIKFYGGNQFWLGHYYRHLFQSIKFVNNHIGLREREKYLYVKIFRAQLSTYEQALLLVNSLSNLGLIWELLPEYKEWKYLFLNSFINGNRIRSASLITKFNLIKNLPGEEIADIKYKDFYPRVEYEMERLLRT